MQVTKLPQFKLTYSNQTKLTNFDSSYHYYNKDKLENKQLNTSKCRRRAIIYNRIFRKILAFNYQLSNSKIND